MPRKKRPGEVTCRCNRLSFPHREDLSCYNYAVEMQERHNERHSSCPEYLGEDEENRRNFDRTEAQWINRDLNRTR